MPIYYYILIIVGCAVLYVVIGYIINIFKDKLLFDEIEVFCLKNKYNYQKSSSKIHDILIYNDEIQMFIKICKIPDNSSVTINSKETWCLRFGGGKRKGHHYPNKRYLNELVPFLKTEFSSEKKTTYKVVVLYPSTEVILKYLNESEIIEVKPKDISYGVKVIKYSDFEQKFNDLLILKK